MAGSVGDRIADVQEAAMQKVEEAPTKRRADRRVGPDRDKEQAKAAARLVAAARVVVAKAGEAGAVRAAVVPREQLKVKREARTKDAAGDHVTPRAVGGGPPIVAAASAARRNPSLTEWSAKRLPSKWVSSERCSELMI